MEKTILIFPDNRTLSEFLDGRELAYVEAQSKHHSLIAPLSPEEIRIARNDFNGVQISFYHFQKSFD